MNVQPKFVGPDPLLIHEGNPFLDVFDLREPWGPPQEGNFDPVFQKQTGLGSVRRLTDYLKSHVRWRDLVEVLGNGHEVPKNGLLDRKGLCLE